MTRDPAKLLRDCPNYLGTLLTVRQHIQDHHINNLIIVNEIERLILPGLSKISDKIHTRNLE